MAWLPVPTMLMRAGGLLLAAALMAAVAFVALRQGVRSNAAPDAATAPPAADRPVASDARPATATAGPAGGPVAGPAPRSAAPWPAPPNPRPTIAPPVPGPSGLVVPVAGVTAAQLSNTFGDARGGERSHEAIDIMAATGTPVLAVTDGTVEKLFDSERGGLTVYQFEASGRYVYYYAHLQRYAAGLAEGQALRRGQVIGYVGSTGNADPGAPHLHFAIFLLGPEREWWRGTPVNPYPLLGGR